MLVDGFVEVCEADNVSSCEIDAADDDTESVKELDRLTCREAVLDDVIFESVTGGEVELVMVAVIVTVDVLEGVAVTVTIVDSVSDFVRCPGEADDVAE